MSKFFTTTDLIERINASLEKSLKSSDENEDITNSENVQKFELQRRFPDGTTRKASAEEAAAADFQAKMKQASQIVRHLDTDDKIRWAEEQRREGNTQFHMENYKEAMDIYLTCLVALESDPENDEWNTRMERSIKMPVLLNLAACSLRLGSYRKTISFCDFCLEIKCAKSNPKVYFRRGKAHMRMGNHILARKDLNMAEKLIKEGCEVDPKELRVIQTEIQRLDKMVKNAKLNKQRQEQAMKRMMGNNIDKKMEEKNTNQIAFDIRKNRYFKYYINKIEKGLRMLLYWLGDDDAMTKVYVNEIDNKKSIKKE